MAQTDMDIETLSRIADAVTNGHHLTPAERAEVFRIAQGFACKDSAAAASVSPETIRARRKRIYHKLGVTGASETLSLLLSCALQQLAPDAAVTMERRSPKQATNAVAH